MARKRNSKPKNNVAMALEKLDFDALLDYATKNRCKKNSFLFQDEFKNQSESDLATIITNLTQMVKKCVEKFVAQNGRTPDADSANMAVKLIQVAVDIAITTLQLKFHLDCHVEIGMMLNDVLPSIPKSQDGVKNSIAQYCEKLIHSKPGKEECFLFNVLPYLLEKTLGKKVYKADIKRIYAIRSTLESVMEYKHTKKDEIWEFVKKCAVSQNYLSILEGQKVIALFLVLDDNKLSEIHTLIMESLPTLNIKLAEPYGRVYFEAWCYSLKLGKDEIKRIIEVTCLQQLILAAIHCGRQPLQSVIRKILVQFSINKKDPEVSRMLYLLYQPLLWRYVKSPEGIVRANATQLLLDIFPLEDPYANRVETDQEINDQMLMLKDLLVDDFPIVRITTVIGVCISMAVNWEVYPEEMLKTYFRIIVNELSRDSSAFEVRVAVIKGLKCLLENPLTVKCLVGILPKMGYLFHDNSENVRIAFVQLLLRIKTISAIKYFDIVPPNHLFARLEEDSYVVKKLISNLLLNSYFPKNSDPKVWFGRCLELMKNHRQASRVFFMYAGGFIGPEASVRYMILAIKTINYYVKTRMGVESSNPELSEKENIVDMEEYLASLEAIVGFSNSEIVNTVMECMVIMWISLRMDTRTEPEDKYLMKMFVTKVGDPLSTLCLYYKDTQIWESVFYMSSFLPSKSVPYLAGLCFSKLKNVPPDAKPKEYSALLECLCNQLQEFELLYLIREWIVAAFKNSQNPAATKKRRITRSSEFDLDDCEPKPYLANRMLHVMIEHRCMQKVFMQEVPLIYNLFDCFTDIKLKLVEPSTRQITQDEASFLSLFVYNLLRLSVFFASDRLLQESGDSITFIDEIVPWANENLLKLLTFSTDMSDPFNDLVFTICQNIAEIVCDVVGLGNCNPDYNIYLHFFENLLLSEMGYRYAYVCSRFFYKFATSGMHLYQYTENPDMLHYLTMSLINVLGTFSDESLIMCLPPGDNVTFMLGHVMQIIHNHRAYLSDTISQAFKCFLQIILNEVIPVTSEIVNEMNDDPFDNISFPVVSTFFLTILNSKPKAIPTYISILNEMFLSSSKDISLWITIWAIIYHILNKKDSTKLIIKETNSLTKNLGKAIHEIYPREKVSEGIEESPMESPQMLIFQRHCHAEFLKLKSCLISKFSALKNEKKTPH